MRFNKLNMGKYNVMEVNTVLRCSICNAESNYVDYWNGNKFCSSECQERYYKWIKENSEFLV